MIICAVFGGCKAEKKESIALQTVFECDFSAQYNETELGGGIKFDENGAKITLTKPDTLSGAQISVNNADKKISLTINGLTIDFDENRYPSAAFARLICGAIASGAGGADFNSENNTLSGDIGGTDYEICIDESGRPKTLLVPSYSLKMNFFNYK